MAEARRFSWFSKLASAEHALYLIKMCCVCFYVYAGIGVVLDLLGKDYSDLSMNVLVIFAVVLLRKLNSRVAAIFLLLFGIAEVGGRFANGTGPGHVVSLVFGLLMLWLALRAVEAAFKLKRLSVAVAPPVAPPIA